MDIISDLEDALDKIVEEFEIPAAWFAEAMADHVEQRRWDELEKAFGGDGVRQIRNMYDADPTCCVRLWREAAESCKDRFARDASEHLTRLSRVNFPKVEPHDFAEYLQFALDPERNLLSVAFAHRLIGLIRPARGRARELRDLVAAEASSPAADAYLSEACECYFFGLFTASAVMCRSLLEEALERKLPTGLLTRWKSDAQSHNQELTLGTLLWRVNNHDPLPVPPKFLTPARQVNKIATQAAHKKAISQDEARDCFHKARQAVTILLGGDPNASDVDLAKSRF